ncbi:MAG: hypothetical protein L0241_09510 [Planctomycetia bacterium]|nr:hypothetical protein [Planctomycetia bacterium]
MLALRAFLSATLHVRRLLPIAAVGCLLVTPTTAQPPDRPQPQAQPPAGKPADQAAIDQAIEAGVAYLRRTQNPAGHWGSGTGPGSGKGWAVGYTALAGLTLVECDVPTSDPGLKRAAAGVRSYINELDSTYEIALVILFLDRMGEKSDKRWIQMLAGRLMAGQSPSGGWGYKVPKHNLADTTNFLNALRRLSPAQPATGPSPRERPPTLGLCIKSSDDVQVKPSPPFDPKKARAAALTLLPPNMKRLPILFDTIGEMRDDPKEKRSELVEATTDNSNTHFAMLALWAARKHNVPTDRSFALLTKRFRTSQGQSGTWSYDFASKGANGTGSMTCVALLGIAIGHVVNPDPNVRPEQDPAVLSAFVALSRSIGEPVGRTDNRPAVKEVGGLYFLWAMERVAVLYDVQKLGKKDWYKWGAEILICHQKQDGSWEEGGYPGQHPALNTCFALMFLKRANLTPDLSRRLTVDTTTLTAKVDDKITPKPPPPTPSPKIEEPPPTPEEPPPPPSEEPKPQVAEPKPAPPPEPAAETAAPAKKSGGWLWIVLAILLAGIVGGFLAFLVAKRMKKNAEEEEKPRKKKAKGKKKVKVED